MTLQELSKKYQAYNITCAGIQTDRYLFYFWTDEE